MSGKRGCQAFSLAEMVVALGVVGLLVPAIMSFFLFTSRSVASMNNYCFLDKQSQLVLDVLTKQIRQASQLSSYTTTNGTINGLTFTDYDGASLVFRYDPGAKTLTRTKGGVTSTYLTGCTSLEFDIFQGNVLTGTFDAVSTATATNCKLVQVSWTCSKNVFGSRMNTETMQSAKITIRQAQ